MKQNVLHGETETVLMKYILINEITLSTLSRSDASIPTTHLAHHHFHHLSSKIEIIVETKVVYTLKIKKKVVEKNLVIILFLSPSPFPWSSSLSSSSSLSWKKYIEQKIKLYNAI